MTSLLIAIDPGVHGCGVAHFLEGVLYCATYEPSASKVDIALLPEDFLKLHRLRHAHQGRFILEKPQVYKTRLMKGDPNDLIDVAVAGGEMLGRMLHILSVSNALPTTVERIRPAEWKKQLPKEVVKSRIEKLLTPYELARIQKTKPASLMHNVWDAVGIGLWGVKRFKP